MLAGPGLKGRFAQQQISAFARQSRSISSFRPQITRFPVRNGKTLGGSMSWKAPIPTIALPAARFNSTSTPSSNGSEAAPWGEQVPADWDISNLSLADIPERIGYLKDIGLDYGWGPSSMVEWLLEHVHIYSGMPWMASIFAAGVICRLVMLPLFMRSVNTGAKSLNNQHVMSPLRTQLLSARMNKQEYEAQKIQAQISKINAELGIKPSAPFIPLAIQMPLGFAFFRVVNGMADLPVPGLAAEKFAWLTDLTVADPYYFLPILFSVLIHYTIKKGGEDGIKMAGPGMQTVRKGLMWGMPALSFVFVISQPAALQLYFCCTAIFGLIQAHLFSSHAFRRTFGIEIAKPPGPGGPSGTGYDPSRSLNLISEILEKEQAKIREAAKAAGQEPGHTHSFIDRAINNFKEQKAAVGKEMTEKMKDMTGKGPKKNPDGSTVEERLSEKDRKLAADYEKRRKEEEEWKREERNHARRQAHQQQLERQQAKAKSALKNHDTKQ